ncbi:MAG: hypothetical protein ACM3Q9_02405 [Methanosarcina sp.]
MRPGVVSLVASAVVSLAASMVAIDLRRGAAMPQSSGDCAAAILPTTLRDSGVGA